MEKDNESTLLLPKDQSLELLKTMLLIRFCEEQLVKSYARGEIPGGMHTYIGEEATATGVCANLRIDDAVFSSHRGHGHALAKGMKPEILLAEVLGKVTGSSAGRGGSMHLFAADVGFYGTSGIVGPSILLASGAGYTAKLEGSDKVGVAFFGDGASNNGVFHEGINMATAWQLPVIFVCENNFYTTEVAFSYASKSKNIAPRAAGYGLPGVVVDGNDVLTVYQAAHQAVERARSGDGPTLIECQTYRTHAHAEGMNDTGYRTQEEIDQWKEHDPIENWKKRLIENAVASEQEVDGIGAEVFKTVEDAIQFARQSPMPDPSNLFDHLFSQEVQHA